MEQNELVDWAPFGIRWEASTRVVDWCYLGSQRFIDPFFDHTINQRRQPPHHRDWYRVTPIQALDVLQAISPGLRPTGFIFHVGHCGSTLIAQLLAALSQNIVISEATILSSVLGPAPRDMQIADGQKVQLLRGVVGALGRRRAESEKFYFIKFGNHGILHLPLIHTAFPDVPWIFLYRDPLEVLVAQLRHAREVLPPGVSEAGLIDEDPAILRQMEPEEFWARVLARRCAAALEYQNYGKSLFVNYEQLPRFVWESLPNFFGLSCSADDLERMQFAARFNAKDPSRIFAGDREIKRRAATQTLRALVERWVMSYYRRLETTPLGRD